MGYAGTKEEYDVVARAGAVAKVVCKGDLRKYHRFLPGRFYGGIATADCIGCCLRCIFCWSWQKVVHPEAYGQFCSPQEVANKLMKIARKKGFHQVRISGNEPTVARDHLLKILERMPDYLLFILETNGILLGRDKTYADDLARFNNLYVRVSFKGTNEEEFSLLTGARPSGFTLQLQALKNLYRAGVQVHPALMASFSPLENIRALQSEIGKIDPSFGDIEIEELALYGNVEERLRKAKIACKTP